MTKIGVTVDVYPCTDPYDYEPGTTIYGYVVARESHGARLVVGMWHVCTPFTREDAAELALGLMKRVADEIGVPVELVGYEGQPVAQA